MKLQHILAAALLLVATRPSLAQMNDAEAKTLASYPLTMDVLTRHFLALVDVHRMMAKDPEFNKQMTDWGHLSLEEQVRRYSSIPKAAAAAKAHGISVRDFVLSGIALVDAMYAANHKGKAAGAVDRLLWAAASPDHVKFYLDHRAEIGRLQEQVVDAME
jgi:hypothetical protein